MNESSKAAQGGRRKINCNLESCKTSSNNKITMVDMHTPCIQHVITKSTSSLASIIHCTSIVERKQNSKWQLKFFLSLLRPHVQMSCHIMYSVPSAILVVSMLEGEEVSPSAASEGVGPSSGLGLVEEEPQKSVTIGKALL